jgi:hypothetical protein
MKKTKNIPIIIFISVTLLSGWLGVLVDMVLTEQPEGEDSLGMGIWLVLPLLTAIILSIINKDFKDAGLKPKFKGNFKWYLLSLTTFPAAGAIALIFAKIFDLVKFTNIDIGVILPVIAVAFGFNIIKNIFEEFAWRGFLTPKLLECEINDWWLYAISGLVWALWHVPYYIVFLDESVFESLSVSRIGFTVIGVLVMLCWNILYVEMFRLTKTVWTCTIMHAAEDGVVLTFFIGSYYVFSNGLTAWIFDPHIGIIVAVLILVVGFILRKIRIKKELRKL